MRCLGGDAEHKLDEAASRAGPPVCLPRRRSSHRTVASGLYHWRKLLGGLLLGFGTAPTLLPFVGPMEQGRVQHRGPPGLERAVRQPDARVWFPRGLNLHCPSSASLRGRINHAGRA